MSDEVYKRLLEYMLHLQLGINHGKRLTQGIDILFFENVNLGTLSERMDALVTPRMAKPQMLLLPVIQKTCYFFAEHADREGPYRKLSSWLKIKFRVEIGERDVTWLSTDEMKTRQNKRKRSGSMTSALHIN